MRRAALLIALALAGPALAGEQRSDWREVITIRDRKRLRDWRTAWTTALADARAHGGAATIAADPALFDPDRALVDRSIPAPGEHRCRRVALGPRPDGSAQAIEPWGRCRIEGPEAPLRLVALDGGQRVAGAIYADTDRRAIFLGTTMFPDEHRPATYGHAAGRDVVGSVERIGERRWRLALPQPGFGMTLELVELEPAT